MKEKLEGFWRDNGGWIIAILVCVAAVVVLLVGCNGAFYKECADTAEIMNLSYKHSFYIGCLVDVPEYGWVKLDEYQKMILLRTH